MTDQEFLDHFEAGTLPADSFHHAEHVRLAWLYLRRHGVERAIPLYCEGLQAFARRNGAEGLFHATITWAFLLLIHERMARGDEESWEDFRRANPDLMHYEPNPLHRYYRPETLSSELARRVFLLPDRGLAGNGSENICGSRAL